MPDFHFRYNFVPVTGMVNGVLTTTVPYNKYKARHDIWDKKRHTGQLEVKLTTLTETIVGSTHKKKHKYKDDSPYFVEQYTWKNQIAIPANSIRGMISSIAETLSQSALRVLDDKYKPAFKKISTSNNLTPWDNDRTSLTPAELIFGVVNDNQGDGKNENIESGNLKSRVNFYDATLCRNQANRLGNEHTLKELSSPKADGELPKTGGKSADIKALSLYFRPNNINDSAISHKDVIAALNSDKADFNGLHPNGRKFYLLHNNHSTSNYENINKDQCRKAICKLIPARTEFKFIIKYHNLTTQEYTLLIKSIVPNSSYYHAIGLGKALGLGAIKLEISKETCRNIKQDYAETATHTAPKHQKLPPQDEKLIDVDSLNSLCLLRDISKAPQSSIIRERNGYKEKTRPMPSTIACNRPPVAKAYNQQADTEIHISSIDIPPAREVMPPLGDSAQEEWLMNTLSQLNNNQPFSDLSEDNIKISLKGNGLGKKFSALPESERKEQVRKLICKQLQKYKIAPNYISKPKFVKEYHCGFWKD